MIKSVDIFSWPLTFNPPVTLYVKWNSSTEQFGVSGFWVQCNHVNKSQPRIRNVSSKPHLEASRNHGRPLLICNKEHLLLHCPHDLNPLASFFTSSLIQKMLSRRCERKELIFHLFGGKPNNDNKRIWSGISGCLCTDLCPLWRCSSWLIKYSGHH